MKMKRMITHDIIREYAVPRLLEVRLEIAEGFAS